MSKVETSQGIAIIGISLRFPKSDTLDEFWDHLISRDSLITEIPLERWDKNDYYGDPQKDVNKTNSIWGGFIDRANCFDASFFNISPREATYMDPQQRITLELAWKAIEDAGYRAGALKSTKTGVFMGVCNTDYTEMMEKYLQDFDTYVPTGTSNAILSNRISYWFDFKGPSITIDSACASSLVAIHQAVRSLENKDCEYALAGGVNLCWSPRRFIALSKSGMLSKDGSCKAFDEKADGYVRAEGAAVLLLKPLDKAIEDRDTIYAVIKGVGTNHGGRTNSLTITNPKAQAELIVDVYEKAGVSPDSVSYIETHGPGTPLGDPIEIHGLKNAFKHLYQKVGKDPKEATCGLGSVKTNIGHLEAAAGIAGVIKVLAAMKHRTLPASIHFQQKNPIINFEGSPFYIVNETIPWNTFGDAPFPRRAGVSSFGFGGSNAHIFIEEYVPESQTELPTQELEDSNDFALIPFSARNAARLREYVAMFLEYLQKSSNLVLRDMAYTLQVGREAMPERVIFLTRSVPELISQCEAFLQNEENQANGWRGGQVKEVKGLDQLPEVESFTMESKSQWYADCPAEKIAELWTEGYIIEWELLYTKNLAKRINLLTYPFARESYWFPIGDPGSKGQDATSKNVITEIEHSPKSSQNNPVSFPQNPPVYTDPTDKAERISLVPLSAINIPSVHIQSGGKPRITLTALDVSSELPEWKNTQLSAVVVPEADIAMDVLMNELTISLAEALAMNPGEIDIDAKFIDLGLDSIIGVEWVRKVNDRYHTSLAVTKVYDYPSIREFTGLIAGEINKQPDRELIEFEKSLANPPIDDPTDDFDGYGDTGLPPLEPVILEGLWDSFAVEGLREDLKSSLAEALFMKRNEIDDNAKFVDLGLDSIIGVEWIRKVNEQYQTSISVTRVYDYSTLYEFAEFLAQELQKQGKSDYRREVKSPKSSSPANQPVSIQAVAVVSFETLREELKAGLAEALSMQPGDIDDDAKFVDLGLDSIIGVEWIHKVNERYSTSVAVTKVYDYPTIAEFTGFILQEVNKTKKYTLSKLELTTVAPVSPFPSRAIPISNVVPPAPEGNQTKRFEEPVVSNQPVVALREIGSGVIQITMQDRMNKNKFSEELIQVLIQTIESIQTDPKYKIIILTGYDTFFAAGGTQENLLDIFQGKAKYTDSNLYRVALDCKIPIIAAMQGHGIGAGWCFGMSCDFVVMSQESYYSTNFMKFGFTPGFGSTLIFPEKLGIGLAQEILFTGKRYRGSELQTRGIPFPVLSRAEVLPYAIQLANELAESPREALILLKNHMVESLRERISITIEKEIRMHDQTFVNQAEVKDRIQSLFGQFSPDGQSNTSNSVSCEGLNTSTRSESYSSISSEVSMKISSSPDQALQNSIAIIGVSGQFPKSRNLTEFWDNIANGRDCISEVPANRWSVDQFYDPDPEAPGKSHCKWMGALEDADLFDPLFFNISPAEAELMDPQQRLFLEHCWSSIEDAGLNPASLSGSRCGVFVGCATNDYGQFIAGQELNAQRLMGGSSSILSSRISYYLNLKGPCLAIDTACSSSLVAIAEACNSLVLQTSDLALAGGVCVLVGPEMHIMTSKAGMLSKDGRCFTFDNRANGFVPSEGVGVVLLKRLADAIRDQDHIHGVIRGWGINQDGRTNGITAPSVNSQIFLQKEVYKRFGINPESISMVEAHGTGTKLGDPIEVEALTKSFQAYTQRKNYCALGSVKSNIGHPLTAAGVAGVIKVLLAMRHRMLPPTIHYEKLNEHISLSDSPFYINNQMQSWETAQSVPRRACVSSFGFSGTNSHVVIEEYSPTEVKRSKEEIHSGNPALFVLSAKGDAQLNVYAGSMVEFLKLHPELDLADMAYTLQVGREAMDYRLAFIADSREAVLKALMEFMKHNSVPGILTGQVKKGKDGMGVLESDADAKSLAQTWFRKKKFTQIADLWVKGLNLDWNQLYDSNRPRRISLPTYPFGKESFWVEVDPVQVSAGAKGLVLAQHLDIASQAKLAISQCGYKDSVPPVSEQPEPYEIMTFEEVWKEKGLEPGISAGVKTLVCFLSQPQNQQAFSKAWDASDPGTNIIFIAKDTAFIKRSSHEYSISAMDPESYRRALQSIQNHVGNMDAVLYLWALEDQSCIQDPSAIVYILQAFAGLNRKPGRFLLAAQIRNALDRCYLESWIGFERSLGLVLPQTQVAAIYHEDSAAEREFSMGDWALTLRSELGAAKAQSGLYKAGKRHVYQIQPATVTAEKPSFRSGGTYLITGGCGGLGYLFAEHLAKAQSVNLILTGRSALDSAKQSQINRLQALGSRVIYLQADIGDREAMTKGLHQAKESFGEIHGVIHAAGVAIQLSIFDKGIETFQAALASKIKGTLLIDDLLCREPLDFICYFSSSSAILGDFGACDYAVANRFQMAYARYRNQLQYQGERQGKAIAINWPLWRDGGMGFEDEQTEMYLKSSGQRYLDSQEGTDIFDRILGQGREQLLVLAGQPSRVLRFLGLSSEPTWLLPATTVRSGGKQRPVALKGLSLAQCLEWDLKEQISKLLKISREKITREENLADFGFDSIYLANFATILTGHFGFEISPAVFFGHTSLEKLVQYFITEHAEAVREFYPEDVPEYVLATTAKPATSTVQTVSKIQGIKKLRFAEEAIPKKSDEPIAIIGMSGRFPDAYNIEEMWTLLAEGRNAVKEIPSDRFDWRLYYQDSPSEPGKTNSKWCGCIPGAAEFDPLFFEISPREAESMDPRQRLLMQEAWKALEDAGYGPARIQAGKIGMFVGVEDGDYQKLVQDRGNVTSNHTAILAARLAYFLNLSGPVMAINTACSSGLVAAHEACLSLRAGECDTAIAAGVNLMLTPDPFINMSKAGMLSGSGKCHAFDKRADGLVPGEAVAVVVFKRLSQAQADGDPIYAVIRGSGINYDGKTNGITAPSGVSQVNLLKSVYNQYQVNPEEIEFIISHGTGTKLGDPIEINALNDAFKDYTHKQGYCAVTSTKTNFGHTFAASGLVSLIALVQSLRHETIPASLHCEQENDYINWHGSPFYVNKANRRWPAKPGQERLGAVSAFGMSGTNAHLVVQSYLDGKSQSNYRDDGGVPAPYTILAVSARTPEALQEKIAQIIAVLRDLRTGTRNLSSMSYTLLEGRQHFDYRCAVVIQDPVDAVYALQQAGGTEKLPNLFQGRVSREFTGQKAIYEYTRELLIQSVAVQNDRSKYQEILCALADFYCQGYDLAWNLLFGERRPSMIHLPTYPFSRENYWAPQANTLREIVTTVTDVIHPLLHQNTSDFMEQRYSSVFSGREFFLADHRIKGLRVLPGVAYLEMVRAAVAQAAGVSEQTCIRIENMVWARPITVDDQPVKVHIGLFPEADDEIAFEIYTETGGLESAPIIHSQGTARLNPITQSTAIDLQALRSADYQQTYSGARCYEEFRSMQLQYGTEFQGIKKIYVAKDRVLAELSLPSIHSDQGRQFALHPGMMDSALQSSIGWIMHSLGSCSGQNPSIPFALDEVEIFGKSTSTMWALIWNHGVSSAGIQGWERGGMRKLDLELYDEEGTLCVRMKGCASRVMEGEPGAVGSETATGTLLVEPYWREAPITGGVADMEYNRHLVVLCDLNEIDPQAIEKNLINTRCLAIKAAYPIENMAERFETYAIQLFEEIQNYIQTTTSGKMLIQIVHPSQGGSALYRGFSGLLRTAQLENPKLIGQIIEVESTENAVTLGEKLSENRNRSVDLEISYRVGKRYSKGWNELQIPSESRHIPWKDDGVYLITGGTGGLGLIFAREILRQTQHATLILAGRSTLDEEKLDQLKQLERSGACIEYQQMDVTQKEAVDSLIKNIQKKYGNLHGIIHSAGVVHDNYILKKNPKELQEVLGPKVAGLLNLDEASRDIEIDFLILFSSSTGTLGNPGQADYAMANTFMDAFAGYRNSLVAANQRHGKTLSVNWSLWKEGGMRVNPEMEKFIRENTGISPIRTETGIQALYDALGFGRDQVMVLEGDRTHLYQKLLAPNHNEPEFRVTSQVVASDTSNILEKVQATLVQILAQLLKVTTADIDADVELSEYGLNLVLLAELVDQLNQIYQLDLSARMFLEQFTLNGMADYLISNYEASLFRKYSMSVAKSREENKVTAPVAQNMLAEKSLNYFKKLISSFIKLPLHHIETDAHMEKYGLDSVMVLELTNHLEKTFGSLSKTLFFEYQSIQQLTSYFLENYQHKLVELLGSGEKVTVASKEIPPARVLNLPVASPPVARRRSRFATIAEQREEKATGKALDIAIIGLSGRYPGAENLQEFWRNLRDGKDCITEIPDDRWDHRLYFQADKNIPGKTYSKWGGFIDGVSEFDPLFFNISPREAEMMDPQERLFLECVYSTLEDAGYTRQTLGTYQGNGMPGNVGVFVGVMYEEYQLYAAQAQILGTPMVLSGNPASIANRVSFFCDFHGPSMSVDTMCSSSLTTIHLACQSLQRGECEAAIAGGVNVSIHPNKYLVLGQGKFVSSKGRCESFGQGGDGYVPGEGVGAVLLKPLSKAVADGDHIYGVIKGTAINHGGKTNSYTVPNPNAQSEVIKRAFVESGVHPRTISYMEAHGTGTSLGDPIEIAGLNKVFREYTNDHQFCAIGSVKSNIGHCESAAGIAGITKVLLQLKYRQLVPSLHSEVLNPNIDFSNTSFVVQQELAELKRPVVTINGETREYPIIAGVSSFGAGGSNAHVLISEYVPEEMGQPVVVPKSPTDQERVIVVLSAKNEDRLKARAQQLLTAIRERQVPEESLVDLGYTLQTGREAMEERLATVVSTIQELSEKLECFIAGTEGIEDLYLGQVKRNKDTLEVFAADDDLQKAIEAWIIKGKYSKLMDLWVKGLNVDWHKLYGHFQPKRISLPTYPFARERYWIPDSDKIFTDPIKAVSDVGGDQGIQRIGSILKKQWELCPSARNILPDRTIVICTTEQNRSLATLLTKYFPNHRIIGPENSKIHTELTESQWKNYGGWIDLIGGEADSDESQDWIVWLQHLIEYGSREGQGLRLLGVTSGLETFHNSTVRLCGAERVGLYRMLQNEYSYLRSRHLDTDPEISDLERAEQIAMEFLADSQDPEVCYRNGERYRAYLAEFPEPKNLHPFMFPKDHVLWITGGTRGLGYLCAKHFVTRYGVKRLVLTGREALPPREEWDGLERKNTPLSQKIRAIRELEAEGANVSVSSVPLTDQESLQGYLAEIRNTMGPIGGIIHCAGIGDADNPAFIRKTVAGIQSILEPKVVGLETLYRTLKNEPLKFFILFSSVSSIIPTLAVGQSDYAMANSYMDYFAEAYGSETPLVSIQWPSWKESGMGEIKSRVYQQTGLLSMTNAEGLQLLDHILSRAIEPVVLPAIVNPEIWRAELLMRTPGSERITGATVSPVTQSKPSGIQRVKDRGDTVETAVHHWLKDLFGEELKLDPEKLDLDTEFQNYGLDSVLLAQVVRKIDQKLGEVAMEPSALIEFPTIKSLADYLVKTYPEAFDSMLIATNQTSPMEPECSPEFLVAATMPLTMSTPVVPHPPQDIGDRIAVVGLACHFPDAEDVGQYWINLRTGRDSIREVPKSRWNWEKYYDPRGFQEGKSISKWGAFLAEIEDFDPQYFKIAEGIAHQIDPLQRQWLEVSAEALADAGFSKNDLWGKAVGVFAGARTGNFSNKFCQTDKDRIIGTGQNFIAAHLAHIYNFKGPNMVIDTACSSSLTAIHSAVRSIQSGESELALAGGVDILLDEAVYLTLSSAKVLSPDGRCKTFDAEANGIGLGEGCGVLVLKSLSKAIQDGNKIYGVIDGSAINNDGNTMGVTTPNPEAQRDLIEKTIAVAGVNPETISYVETHGTGTLIGDPIELKALTHIFAKYSAQKQFCGVGSVKSNIGHLLSAAGAASIIKVLLAMIHQELPPTLHCGKPNPRFNFQDSPFYIVQDAKPWTTSNGILRAGISAFGLGGNNAHIIISNEGIPAHLRASVVPRGEKIEYNRKWYWPEEISEINRDDNDLSRQDEEEEFLEFFKFNQE
ncbi:SDR family NAD(P)-dependent oxidoreductase [Paenibacillus sp. chi10]|uniref:SDR family NAD(P)-dependent oxidoreductase n=1 Tax=Paenibacillus suaedae TaxID=3077233 RepID=A0AAJ2N556_9BACL|nr:SDR family NAD(P)-dependent oxidoreductase [Paenibacillus sp. chi10]MDT8977370.1 SDR family NAD(P)-dependent oxidoreductase [Paenibacillus sp. chi10]